MNKHALLLSGGINYKNNYIRYQNDLELAYAALKVIGEFPDNNIALLFADGLKPLNMGTVKAQAAKRKFLIDYIKHVEDYLTKDDEFVLVVSNHGGDNGIICLWENDYIEQNQLARLLNKIEAKKIIVLCECFAGDFLKYDIEKSCIFTANESGKESYSHIKNLSDLVNKNFLYDEFPYHFFSFILGKYPDTKNRIPESCNDLIAAYEYAKANDIFNPENKSGKEIQSKLSKIGVSEIPQIKNNLGEIISL